MYETTFILEPGLDDNRVQEMVDRVSQWVRDLKGEVREVQRWGKRRLSYEIRKKRDGIYVWMLHDSPSAAIRDIERRMRLEETMLRVLTVMHVPIEAPPADAEALAAAAEEADE